MAYKVVLYSSAVKDFELLSSKDKTFIADALRSLADFQTDRSHIKRLRLPLHGYRKRVGKYRILFDIRNMTIYVHAIKHRKDAYR